MPHPAQVGPPWCTAGRGSLKTAGVKKLLYTKSGMHIRSVEPKPASSLQRAGEHTGTGGGGGAARSKATKEDEHT